MNDRQRLEAIIKIVNRCLEPLPPGGSLTDHEAMQEIIGLVDPLPPEAPQFVAGEVTDEVAARTFSHWADAPFRVNSRDDDITMPMLGRVLIAAVRSELGPALGLVEIREPTPEECERICTEYERLLMREGTCGGRDAFDAVRNVMWPKEGL